MLDRNSDNDILDRVDHGEVIYTWLVPEYHKHERSKNWYIGAIVSAFLLLLFSLLNSNFLFAVIIIVAALITLLHDSQEPQRVMVSLTSEGVEVGQKYYDYDEFKNFSVVYKPRLDVKNLYFEYKNALKPRLSVPLLDMDPVSVRRKLLKYLSEDLERTDQPVSEALSKILKI